MPKFRSRGLLGACIALLTLGSCSREGQDEMSWAQAALERNGNIEVVGTDQQTHTFTVRLKDSGELRTVRVDQLVASPVPAPAPAPVTASAAEPKPSPPSGPATTAAPGEAAAPAEDGGAAAATPNPAAAAATPSSLLPQTALAAEASPGRVLESGPGYTIKAADAAAAAPAARARTAGFSGGSLEHRHEPIVCQGQRLLHIDNRNLVFDGDAVDAEDGCEIYITNSHLSAAGVGILARAANVHIDNSLIEGEQGSIDASEGAQVYVASSQFKGLRRRLDTATFHDLGGNVWN